MSGDECGWKWSWVEVAKAWCWVEASGSRWRWRWRWRWMAKWLKAVKVGAWWKWMVEWVEMGVSWWCRVVVGDQSEDGEGDGWS